jgi:formamidopyrimidine-DNA glycosylase
VPELPEVETICADLRFKILNLTIKEVLLTSKAKVNLEHSNFKEYLEGSDFKSINRIGKLMIFHLGSTDDVMLVHLKMTGQLIHQKGQNIVAGGHSDVEFNVSLPDKFTRVTFMFSDGGKLYFNDLRRFGYLKIVDQAELSKVKKKFGIEPLTKNFTLANLKKALGKRKTSIKAVLLNQQLIAGIGNIYADEACFDAGIRPGRKANKLTRQQAKKLHQSIQKVIKKAVETRGTTFNNYVDANGNQGGFLKHLKVYKRAGQPCKKCKTILKRTKVAGRGTVFCSRCQK